ncbi:MAG: 2-phosphosulfolactate phosphatase [Candidatus Entotheonellia bacterium]
MTRSPSVEVHLMSGEAGCRWAREHHAVAIVVDALRASATITLLLHGGARDVIVVKEVAEAHSYRRAHPEALLVGERGGLKVDGFDLGNSPVEIQHTEVRGRQVAFTSTTGAQRMVDCLGASAIMAGTTINATAVAQQATRMARAAEIPIVIIPAGLATDPDMVAEEDWLGAVVLATHMDIPLSPESQPPFQDYQQRIRSTGLLEGFLHAEHGQKLVHLGFIEDIRLCAQVDLITDTVPILEEVVPLPCGGRGLRLRRGNSTYATPL